MDSFTGAVAMAKGESAAAKGGVSVAAVTAERDMSVSGNNTAAAAAAGCSSFSVSALSLSLFLFSVICLRFFRRLFFFRDVFTGALGSSSPEALLDAASSREKPPAGPLVCGPGKMSFDCASMTESWSSIKVLPVSLGVRAPWPIEEMPR